MDKHSSLSKQQLAIIREKGTEYPFTGEYTDLEQAGTYLCRQCGIALYRANSKFHSGCGWPSFDTEIADHVTKQIDVDGHRTEILCKRCNAHLGHVFHGEGFTLKNTRHCVNSMSLDFVTSTSVIDTDEAIFAAGCFWGVEHFFKQLNGVIKTEAGYIGGHIEQPTYQEICAGLSGHYEAVRIVYDPCLITYEQLTKYFFEIHDPTQKNGQGPDLGEQYLSVIFYYNQAQHELAAKLVAELKRLGYEVATRLKPVNTFWPAETFHQDYYAKIGKQPYCHRYIKRFKD